MIDLKKMRQQIDEIDRELLIILAKRFEVTKKVGEYKAKHNLPSKDPAREKQIFEEKKAMARKLDLNFTLVEQIFKLIIGDVRQRHNKIKNVSKK